MSGVDGSTRAEADRQLVRGLGVRQFAATIFNATVGSGIFVLPALTVATLGTAAPLAYLVCALAMALIVLVCAEAGSRVEISGGPYAYVAIGLGPLPGFIAALLLTLSNLSAAGAISVLLGKILARALGIDLPGVALGITVTLLLALAAVNVRGLAWGARAIEIFTVAKLLPLLLFVFVGVFYVRGANLSWGALPEPATVVAASGTLIFAFFGLEQALTPGGEVRDPARTVPRAAMLVIGGVTLLYLAVQFVALGILGADALSADRVAPLATAAGTALGPLAATILIAGASVSMLGYLTGSLLTNPRVLFALGRDGFLPAPFAAVHARFRTPWIAISLYTLVVLGVSLTGSFEQLAVLSNLSALVMYSLVAIAVWRMRRRGIQTARAPFQTPGGPLVPILTVLTCGTIAVLSISPRELLALGLVGLLAVGVVLFRSLARSGSARS